MLSSFPIKKRLDAFVRLGELLLNISEEEKTNLFQRAKNQNPWFVSESMNSALDGICMLVEKGNLEKWLSAYELRDFVPSKNIGILMAGNIPAVGFHDLMCVLLSGHIASVKLSSSDSVFPSWLIDKLLLTEPEFDQFIRIEEMLKGKDAYIATGSDNSARYFNYYFGKYPHIIRSNRTSVAVLSGNESEQDLVNLGSDIFYYFGLGCRNVSKIFVRNMEILPKLLRVLEKFDEVASHHKYFNNYEYNKSIYLVNREDHLDNGFLLLKESEELVSPIGVLFYEVYKDNFELKNKLASLDSKIQCVIGNPSEGIEGSIPFGKAQLPAPWDYADKVDTLGFLLSLS